MNETLQIVEQVIGYGNKFLDSFLMLLVMYYCFPAKPPFQKNIKWAVFFWTILAAMVNILWDESPLPLTFYIFLVYYFLVGLSFAVLFLQGRLHIKAFMGLAYTAATILCRYFLTGVYTYFANRFFPDRNHILGSIVLNLTAQLMLVLLVTFLVKNLVRTYPKMPAYYWIFMLVIIFVDFAAVLPIPTTRSEVTLSQPTVLLMVGNALLVVVMLYYLFSKLTKEYEEKYEYMLMNQQLKLQKGHLKETAEMNNSLRGMRHELKNHIFCMKSLLEEKQYDKLQEYFNGLYTGDYLFNKIVDTGNVAVDSVLNHKMSYAQSRGVQVEPHVVLPEDINVKDSEISAVLSNLLDNAIEGARDAPAPLITLDLKIVKNYISIVVVNTVKEWTKKKPELQTTKPDKENHGFGIKIIRNIVEKYDGVSSFELEGDRFVASVMLKLSHAGHGGGSDAPSS